MENIERARAIFAQNDYTIVLCKDDKTYTGTKPGVACLMEFVKSGTDLAGFSAADKVVGKAAALSFVFLSVDEVYSPLMSRQAIGVFDRHNIAYTYDKLIDSVLNRTKTGLCPMETAVSEISDPKEAAAAINNVQLTMNNYGG
ncbi:MAG: DUF1893 domain-containing protein [Oscillospiraceae bacterium]|nr:DUF1893 domain-containing protein [Oscillospiraceae bacterium]